MSLGKTLLLASFGMIGLFVFNASSASATPKNNAFLSSHIPNYTDTIVAHSNGCRSRLNAQGSAPYTRSQVNASGPYASQLWPSIRNQPANVNATVPYTQLVVPMQLNSFIYLCAALVNNSANGYVDNGAYATTSNMPNERTPAPSSQTIHYPASWGNMQRIESLTVVAGSGSVSGLSTNILRNWRENDSRYWYSNEHPTFDYNRPSTSSPSETITIRVEYSSAQHYYGFPGGSGTTECVDTRGAYRVWRNDSYPGDAHVFNTCSKATQDVTIRINIDPPPPTYNHVVLDNVVGGDLDVEPGGSVTINWDLCNRGNGVFYPENNSGSPNNGPIRIRIEAPYILSGPRAGDRFERIESTYVTYSAGSDSEITKAPQGGAYEGHARWEIRKNAGVPNAGSTTSENACGGFASGGRGPGSVGYSVPTDAVPGDRYCFTTIVYPKAGVTGPESTVTTSSEYSGISASDRTCFTIIAKPYTSVYGGDIAVGYRANCAGWTLDTPHTAIANANIYGFNKGSSGSFAGAGVEFASYAQAAINNFASSKTSPPGTPRGLSFANTAGTYGGSFGSTTCPANYYSRYSSTPGILSGASGDSLSSITTTTDLTGKNVVVVNGNLIINDDVTYDSWSSLSNMPSLTVVVRGNIYITPNVQVVEGNYIAQPINPIPASTAPSPSNGGYIITCTDTSLPNPASTGENFIATNCGNKLTIRGSVVALGLRLYRTNGTLSDATANEGGGDSNIAESFRYSPASWLTPCNLTLCADDPGIDSIIGLPPVL